MDEDQLEVTEDQLDDADSETDILLASSGKGTASSGITDGTSNT